MQVISADHDLDLLDRLEVVAEANRRLAARFSRSGILDLA